MSALNLAGQNYGRLTALRRAPNGASNKTRWICACRCGNEVTVTTEGLRSGDTNSCGCLRRDVPNRQSHGMSKSPEYRVWAAMIDRCSRPGAPAYKYYGGRGITVCQRWLSFSNFIDDMGRRPSPLHSLDRKNNDGPYAKRNCRWATQAEQHANKSSAVIIKFDGQTKTLSEWARCTGLSRGVIKYRLRRGWDLARVLGEPVCSTRTKN